MWRGPLGKGMEGPGVPFADELIPSEVGVVGGVDPIVAQGAACVKLRGGGQSRELLHGLAQGDATDLEVEPEERTHTNRRSGFAAAAISPLTDVCQTGDRRQLA